MDLELKSRPEARSASESPVIPPASEQLRIVPTPKRVRAVIGGETIADSLRALLLLEGKVSAVYYFPREDVRLDLLGESERPVPFPVKGDAAYWHAPGSGPVVGEGALGYANSYAS